MSNGRLMWTVAVLALVAAALAGPVPVAAQEGKDWAGVWEATGQPVSGRTQSAAVRLDDGRVLVVGDNPDERGRSSAETYDPETGEWSATDPMHHGRYDPALVKLTDGRVLAVGTGGPTESVPEVYDPAAPAGQRWTEVTAPPMGRVLAAVLLDGPACGSGTPPAWCGMVLATGFGPDAVLFDPAGEGQWLQAAPPPVVASGLVRLDGQDCRGAAPPVWCGTPLLAGGDTATLFDPSVVDAETGAIGQWDSTGGLQTPRRHASFTVLADGRVLAAGGFSLGDDEPVATAELYDPAAGTWQHTASLAEADRVGHTATLLDDGSVLVAGGRNDDRDCFASAEVFDPAGDDGVAGNARGAFVAGGLMGQPRASHTATALTDGRALVAGGYESGGCGRNTADVYTPVFLDPQVPAPQVSALDPSAGLVDGGVGVTLSGANLSGASTVMFGDTPAEFSVVSNSQITAVAPVGAAGEVSVGVTTPGGVSAADAAGAQFSYVEASGVWTPVGSLDTPGDAYAATITGGDVLIVTGARTAMRYDPTAGTLEGAADPPDYGTSFNDALVGLADGRALWFDDTAGAVYDPVEDVWQPTAPAPLPIGNEAGVLLADGRVLLVGDHDTTASQIYDPATGEWAVTNGQPVEQALDGATLTSLADGRVLLAGGRSGAFGETSRAQVFNPASGSWSALPDMHQVHHQHGTVLLQDGRALVAGGLAVNAFAGAEMFDPAGDGGAGAWQPARPLVHPRHTYALSLLADGSVLAVGGRGRGEILAVSEVFDPVSGRWLPTGWLNQPRSHHAAVLLEGGCGSRCGGVLVAGGRTASGVGNDTASVELFTPRPKVTTLSPAAGRPGDTVTVEGFFLAGVDAVSLGGTPAEFTIDSPTQITATVPDGVEVGTVDVSVANGVEDTDITLTSHASAGSEFTVQADPGAIGRVDDLSAQAASASEIDLAWSAVADGAGGSAPGYVVAQSRDPITTSAEFDAAAVLCGGVCTPTPTPDVGGQVSLSVVGLAADTTYHYALRARTAAGDVGPLSNTAAATTDADPADPGDPGGGGDVLSPAELVAAACPNGAPPVGFTDVAAIPDTHRDAVACAASHDIARGFADGSYGPGQAVRRDQLASFIARTVRAAGVDLPDPRLERFVDVTADSTHDAAIHRLAAAGIVAGGPGGLSANSYGPGQPIRRDQMASFLVRAAEYATGDQLTASESGRFSDVAAGNVHAGNIDTAAALNLAQGQADGTYQPAATTRRDQMATFLARLLGGLTSGAITSQ